MRALEVESAALAALGADVSRFLDDWYRDLDGRAIAPRSDGGTSVELFDMPLPEEGLGAEAFALLPTIAEHARAQNGRFFGYVLGSGEPVAALGDAVASALNQNITAWRSSPAAATIERTLAEQLAHALGCGGFVGTFCGGGSSANLMGLAMARESKLAANETGARPGVVYVSSEAHMSIPKAVALLGLGRENVHVVPVDDAFRMRTDALRAAIEADLARGRTPLAVVATTGTVTTGSIDPLAEIADVTAEYDLHLHVDGAYGGFAALAVPDRIGPLHRADTISLDLHKWLYQPVDCSLFLYRDRELARRTFAYTEAYVATATNDPIEGFAFFEESIELSRRFRALKAWLSLRYHGLAAYRTSIREDLDLAQALAERIRERNELELLAPVALSAVCFRVRGDDDLNRRVLAAVNANGCVYLSNASVDGVYALRACIVNHRTTPDDVGAVVEEVLRAVP